MNEIYFFLHVITIVIFILTALYLGKNALISCIVLQAVLANLFVLKQIDLFGLNVTCGNVFIVGSILALNLLQEFFGKKIAEKVVWISFFILIFYVVMTQFHILYIPNSYDYLHPMFEGILKFMPRITIASIFVYVLVQKISLIFYAFLKKIFSEKFLFFRNIISLSFVQFIDTVLFTFLGLYGIVESVFSIIIVSFVIKMITILISTPLVIFSKKFINNKKNE